MANAFEAGTRKAIPAVLIYANDGARANADGASDGRVLMIHRNAPETAGRPGDYHAGKWNGLGGKLEPDESPLDAAAREFAEEAGVALDPARFRALGTLTFPNFKAHKAEDWMVFVFTVTLAPDEIARIVHQGVEGELHWVPRAELLSLNLWPGDRHFIPYVAEQRPFLGTIWYEGPRVARHWITGL